jgi:FK506-binding protein 2
MARKAVLQLRLLVLLLGSCCVSTKEPGLEIEVTGGHASGCVKSKLGDTLALHYNAKIADSSKAGEPGAQFDTSRKGDHEPFRFKLGAGEVIKGWDEGLVDMCVGETRALTVPPAMGYGSSGTDSVPVGAVLFFEVELVQLETGEPAAVQVSKKKKWLALLDEPIGGRPSPETGAFMRSGATSVVTCSREKWIKDAFMSQAELLKDRFQFLYSPSRKLCDEISLRKDDIGLVTSVYQSAKEDARDLRALDLKKEAAALGYPTLPQRMARGQLRQFIDSASPPPVGILTLDSMLSTYDSTRPILSLFCPFNSLSDEIDPSDMENRVARQNAFARSPQAKWCRAPLLAALDLLSDDERKSNLTVVVAEIEEHRKMELLEFGFEDLDGVGVAARTNAGYKYRLEPFDGAPSAEVLAEFASNVIKAEQQGDQGAGVLTLAPRGESLRTMQPFLKSAPVPRSGKKGTVKAVVGRTFHEVVMDESNDVLVRRLCVFPICHLPHAAVSLARRQIAFSAPWCEACPGMLAELKAVAASLKKAKAKQIQVAKLDITENDAPKIFRKRCARALLLRFTLQANR